MNQSGYYPDVVENALDNLEMQIQQLASSDQLSLKVPLSPTPPSLTFPSAPGRANQLAGFDVNGNATTYPITVSVGAGSLTDNIFNSGTDFNPGTTTTLTLAGAYGSPANVFAYFDGVPQFGFTISGTSITFPAPIPSGISQVLVKGGTTLSIYVPASRSVGDAQINWNGLLAREAANVAQLVTLSTSTYSHVNTLGYYSAGDGGSDSYFSVASGSPAVFGDIAANDGGIWRRVFRGKVNSKQLGLLGDGNQTGTTGTDQTTLFQSILNSLPNYTTLEFLPGYYNVKSIDFTSVISNCTFVFNDAWISGIATSAYDAIVRLVGCNNSKFYNLQIVCDGAATTVLHQGNYGTALQFKGDSVTNTCFNYFYGGNIRYIKAGITYGGLLGQSPMPSSQMSENWFFGFQFRGVNQCVYGNAINSYSTWIGCLFLAQQMESNSSWWSDASGFCVRNDYLTVGNHMNMSGCEFQRAVQNGSSVYGSNMIIRDAIWEVSCQALITGDVLIGGDADGFFGPAGLAPFAISIGSTGTLTLEDFRISRPSGTATFDRAKLVDATGSINYRVVMRKCHVQEWYFDGSEAAATFVHGCQAKFEEVFIDNSGTTSWYLDDSRLSAVNNVDRAGTSLPTTGTTTSYGGWVVTAGSANGAYQQFTGDAPFGLGQCIRVITTGTGFNLATDTTNRFKVEGNRNWHFSMPLKFGTTNSAAFISPFVDWYDYGGNLISSSSIGELDQPNAAANGYNSWLMLRGVAIAPVNAYTGVLRFVFGTSSTILFCLPSLV